jgi:PAT family beta-lactamase induction signal transducer AmpG
LSLPGKEEKIMEKAKPAYRNPWLWVPSLYFAEGVPYVIVMSVSVIMYKRLGISNTDIALYTSWLYLPWVIKPLWSPFVDMFSTKRFWIVSLQLVIGVLLVSVVFVLPLSAFFLYSIAIFWFMAFASATHDIAADGYYMLALEQHQQAALVGVRSTFYRIAMITGTGILVVLAGQLETSSGGNIAFAWSVTMSVLAVLFLLFFAYHKLILPYPAVDRPTLANASQGILKEFVHTFGLFFKRKDIVAVLAFLLLYRFAEAQLVKLVSPFLLDPRSEGGLGLTTSDVGVVYGTVGIIALTLGGLLGGYVISKKGLKFWLWIMVLSIHLPDAAFVYLSQVQPQSFFLINCSVALEQFGYGFGFTAYMLFMILVSEGDHKTAHYAICTGFMALGMMVPGMFSGMIQDAIGYKHFFLWVIVSTIPGFLVAALVKVDPQFGRKVEKKSE